LHEIASVGGALAVSGPSWSASGIRAGVQAVELLDKSPRH